MNIKIEFFPEYKSFLFRPRVLSRALDDGAAAGLVRGPWRVLRALKGHAILQAIAVSFSNQPNTSRLMENPYISHAAAGGKNLL